MKPRWDEANRRWEASVGSGKSRKWFRSKVEGEEGCAIVERKMAEYIEGPPDLPPGSLAEFVQTVWWPVLKTPGRTTLATRKGYKRALDKWIAPLQPLKLVDLRLEVLQPWVASLTEQLGSAKSVHNVFGVLASAMELAHKTGRISHRDHRLVALPETEAFVATTLDPAQYRQLLDAAAGSDMEGPVFAAGTLALRRDEVCGLKIPNVELLEDRAVVSVRFNRQPHGEEERLKGKKRGQARVLVVPRPWGERLLAFAPEGAVYLFCHKGKPVHPEWVSEQMPELCKEAGVPRVRFHDLRHSAATNLRAAGVPETFIQRAVLGHSSIKTTMLYLEDRGDEMLGYFRRLGG
ncbi:MAG: site-specific integrase [Fimbriimonadaceae bacterium]|nr:site-specific integrase [Fimbriimonadaceae bacterium]QYK56617.1 MAG: site-specific integrase [Fimbriimonadaceae bacterium]